MADHKQPDHERLTGLELYALQIPGAFNKIPVGKLADGVTATLESELTLGGFNRVADVLLRLLVSGSLIIVDEMILPGEVIHVNKAGENLIAYQLIKSLTGGWILKRWDRGPVTTEVTVYPVSSITRETPLSQLLLELEALTPREEPLEIKSSGVIIVENGLGILVPVRSTIARLQDLMATMADTTGAEALTWFITGFVGSIDKLNAKSRSGNRFQGLPDGSTIENASDSAFSTRLFEEVRLLTPLYLEATHNFTVIPGESGIARKLSMMGYINKVKQLQRLLVFVFAEYNITLEFNTTFFDEAKDVVEFGI